MLAPTAPQWEGVNRLWKERVTQWEAERSNAVDTPRWIAWAERVGTVRGEMMRAQLQDDLIGAHEAATTLFVILREIEQDRQDAAPCSEPEWHFALEKYIKEITRKDETNHASGRSS